MQPTTPTSSPQFPSPSVMFMIQPNPQHSPQQSCMHNKRTAFANSIRQQMRDNYRRNVRAVQFNFLSSIGVVSHSSYTQMANFVMEEEQAILVEKFHNDNSDYEDMLIAENTHYYELIETYRFKEEDMHLDSIRFWTKLEQKMISLVDEKQALTKEDISWEVVEKDLDFLLQNLSKEIYYDRLKWVAQRLILPQNFGLISAWIYKIFTILGDDYKEFEKITQLSSALVNLLINFEIKIEKDTLLEESLLKENKKLIKYDTPTGKRWANKELFDKVMTLPLMWRKWFQFQQSSMIEVCIYSLINIDQLIREKLDRIFDTKSQDDHTQLLQQIYDLIYSYHTLLESAANKECRWKLFDEKDKMELPFMKLAATNAQQLIKSVAGAYIWLEMENSSLENVSQLISRTLDHLLFIEKQTERIFLCLVDSQDSQREKSCIPDQLGKEFVQQYKTYFIFNEQHLNENHNFMVVAIKRSFEDVDHFLQDFKCCFISGKLQFFNLLIKWASLNNEQSLSSIKEKSKVFKNEDNKQQNHEFLNQMKRRIAMKLLLRLSVSLVKKPLMMLIYDEAKEIHSLKHLGQVLTNSKKQEYKLTYQLINLVKNLFLSISKEFEHFEGISEIHPKTEDIQRLQANIICQIHLTSQILNAISYPDQKSLWKHAYLMAQMITDDKHKKHRKSLIENVEFVYSRLNKAQCGNIKIYKIKQQLGFLCQNIVFQVFPFQSHYQEFQPENKEDSIKNAEQFIEIIKKETHENDQVNFLDNQQLAYIFSEDFLDKQTDIILELVSKFLEEKIIESILSGIKITRILLLRSPTVEVFKYFQNFIRSSTKVYLKIKELWQTHEHKKVTSIALEFIEDIEEGEKNLFGDDEYNEEKDVEI